MPPDFDLTRNPWKHEYDRAEESERQERRALRWEGWQPEEDPDKEESGCAKPARSSTPRNPPPSRRQRE